MTRGLRSSANFVPVVLAETPSEESAADEPVAQARPPAKNQGTRVTQESPGATEAGKTAEEEASTINARHAGWQYRVPEYKANLIARRWNDILKAQDEE